MAEEVIPFSMVMVPFVIALGYDSIVAVTVTYVASQIGNATSWMSPFSVAVAGERDSRYSRSFRRNVPNHHVGRGYRTIRRVPHDLCRKNSQES